MTLCSTPETPTGLAGTVFLILFFRSRENWWAAIPGSVFLGLAAVIVITQLWQGPAAYWAGAFLFLFMGAGFGAVYVRESSNWCSPAWLC